MSYKESTNTLNNIHIQQVADWLGVKLPSTGSMHCPLPDHEDKKPSFEIRPSGRRWVCYGCNRNGGSIDFVKEYKNIDFLAAKQWLENQTHNGGRVLRTVKKLTNSQIKKPVNSDEFQNNTTNSEIYAFLLTLCPLLESGRTYLHSRGISAETMEAFKIAQMPDESILTKLLVEFGYDRTHAAGLLTKKSTIGAPRIIFPRNSIIFPFLEEGRTYYLQARLLAGTEQYGKWRNLNFHKRRIYNIDALTQNSKQPFAICEGVIDTLSAIELKYNAVGMMGVSAKLTLDQICALRKQEVEILLDWDAPGEKRARDLRRELNRYGVVSVRKKLPSATATDLNEYLIEKKGLV